MDVPQQTEVDELLDPVEVPEEDAVGDDTDLDERATSQQPPDRPRSCGPKTAGRTRNSAVSP